MFGHSEDSEESIYKIIELIKTKKHNLKTILSYFILPTFTIYYHLSGII